jgi:hypothetical protein
VRTVYNVASTVMNIRGHAAQIGALIAECAKKARGPKGLC